MLALNAFLPTDSPGKISPPQTRRPYATREIALESSQQNHQPKRSAMATKAQTLLPLPDPPEREPDDMTSVQHLGENGNLHHLSQYLGNPDTILMKTTSGTFPRNTNAKAGKEHPTGGTLQ